MKITLWNLILDFSVVVVVHRSNWQPVQGMPCLSPNDSCDLLQNLRDPYKDKQLKNGSMEG